MKSLLLDNEDFKNFQHPLLVEGKYSGSVYIQFEPYGDIFCVHSTGRRGKVVGRGTCYANSPILGQRVPRSFVTKDDYKVFKGKVELSN